MAGAGCRPPAQSSGAPGSRAGTADTNASAIRGPARRSNGPGSSSGPAEDAGQADAGHGVEQKSERPGTAWPRVYLIRGARRSGEGLASLSRDEKEQILWRNLEALLKL